VEQRQCGTSDIQLSVLGAGCWEFGGSEYWGPQSQSEADAVVRAAVDAGINYFDTAEAYNEGRSEQALGRALAGVPRDRVVIGSKVSPSNAYRDTLVSHCEQSLKRLKTDFIDIYMIHWPLTGQSLEHFTDEQARITAPPSVEEAFEALGRLVKDGKIRYAGVSNFGPRPLAQTLRQTPRTIVNQLPYNLLSRAVEDEVLPLCRAEHVGVIGYFTLLQGILSGNYRDLSEVPRWQRRTRHFDSAGSELARHGGGGAEAEMREALERIRRISEGSGIPMASLAIRWAVSNPDFTCALVGTRKASRIRENAAAAASVLSADLMHELDAATRPLARALGPGFDYYESADNDRTV